MKKQLCLITLILLFGLALAPSVQAGLVGWWRMDETAGIIAMDASGNGYDATVSGTATWAAGHLGGALRLAGSPNYVQLPIATPLSTMGAMTFSAWVDWTNPGTWARVFDFGTGTNVNMFLTRNSGTQVRFAITRGGSGAENQTTGNQAVIAGWGWHHWAVVLDPVARTHTLYLDGAQLAQNSAATLFPRDLGTLTNIWLGRSEYGADPYFNGYLDDVRLYDEVLSVAQVHRIATGKPVDMGAALDPVPAVGQKDVPRDVVLSWTAGDFPGTHNVYLSTNFDDVNTAGSADPKGTLTAQGLSQPSYNPGRLQFGQTYYWRVDEVNAPPTSTVYGGAIWNFTVEPEGYPIPNIVVTASSADPMAPAENTVNGSGLVNGLHGTEPKTMWRTAGGAATSAWIQYDFDRAYKLSQMVVWNYNSEFESMLGWGFNEVAVEYSADGATWVKLGDFVFAQSPGVEDYASDIAVDFGGIPVKQVKLTVSSNWGGMGTFGLSEVQFLSIPAMAREPKPDSGATGVSPDTVLSWRSGREAASHNLYLAESQDAVAAGTAPVVALTQSEYDPATVELGKTYYWKVDEVNTAEAITTWSGPVWSFSTFDSFTVDDFEGYNDTTNAIFGTWVDGFGTNTNGATVGYAQTPYAERTVRHGGRQSMPLAYKNTGGITSAEATRTFDPAQDWKRAGIKYLVLYFHGDIANSGGALYVKINSTKVAYTGDGADLTKPYWIQWNVDLASVSGNLSSVTKLTVGIEGAGTGTILVDDIALYRAAPKIPAEQLFIEAESGTIAAPMVVQADATASGGKFIVLGSTGVASTTNPPTDGLCSYTFTVQGGVYTMAGRVITSGDNDAFWLRIPDATVQTTLHTSGWVNWNNLTIEGKWGWEDVWSGNATPVAVVQFTLAAGKHTLELRYRDTASQLDALIIKRIDP